MNTRKNESGFTLIEILVVISILVILSTFLVPQVGAIRERARQTKCLGNMRIIGLALQTYAADNNGNFPTDNISQDAFRKLYKIGNVTDKNVFDCPSKISTPGGSAATAVDSTDLTTTDFKFNDTNLTDQSAGDTVVVADKLNNHTSPAQFNMVMVSGAARQSATEPIPTDLD